MMKRWALGLAVCAMAAAPAAFGAEGGFENRCGWVNNPTPANWDLTDKDGMWVIGVQGGHQADGDLPEFPDDKAYWTKVNGSHGYGCGCLTVKTDPKEKRVLQIKGGKVLPLRKCSEDPAIKRDR